MYLIVYTVRGFEGEYKAGPYTIGKDLDFHREDICGFDGVVFSRIERAAGDQNVDCVQR